MEQKSKLVDKTRLENIFSKNKKKRSKNIIDSCLSPSTGSNHLLLNSQSSIPNFEEDFESDEFINKFLSEKINALNISENDFILSCDNSSNEDNTKDDSVNFNLNENEDHLFFNDTITLNNNYIHNTNLATTIDNITYNTENLIFPPKKINNNKNIKFQNKKDNTILSSINDINTEKILNNKINAEISPFTTILNNTKNEISHNSLLPNDNIDLLFKKKLNRNSFLDSLNDDSMKPVMSSFQKSPVININKNKKENHQISENVVKNKQTVETSPTPNSEISNDLIKLKEKKILKEKDNSKNGENIDYTMKSLKYNISDSNDISINSRINFLKEKYLDLQRNNEFVIDNNMEKELDEILLKQDSPILETQDNILLDNIDQYQLQSDNEHFSIISTEQKDHKANQESVLENKNDINTKNKLNESILIDKSCKENINENNESLVTEILNDEPTEKEELKTQLEFTEMPLNDENKILKEELKGKLQEKESLKENKIKNSKIYNNKDNEILPNVNIEDFNIPDAQPLIVNSEELNMNHESNVNEIKNKIKNEKKIQKQLNMQIDDIKNKDHIKSPIESDNDNLNLEQKNSIITLANDSDNLNKNEQKEICQADIISKKEIKGQLEIDINLKNDEIRQDIKKSIDEMSESEDIDKNSINEGEEIEELLDNKLKISEPLEIIKDDLNKIDNESIKDDKSINESLKDDIENIEIVEQKDNQLVKEKIISEPTKVLNSNSEIESNQKDEEISNSEIPVEVINKELKNQTEFLEISDVPETTEKTEIRKIPELLKAPEEKDDLEMSGILDDSKSLKESSQPEMQEPEIEILDKPEETKIIEATSKLNKLEQKDQSDININSNNSKLNKSIENLSNLINENSSSSRSPINNNHDSPKISNKAKSVNIPKCFRMNYSLFSESGDFSLDDDRNSDSVITLFEPTLQIDSSDSESEEDDNIESITYSEDYLNDIISKISEEYEKEIEHEINKQKVFEESYYKSLSKQEMIKDTLDEYELTIIQMIDDTNKIKEKNNFQIQYLMDEINRLKRESEVMNIAYNELQTHYDQIDTQNKQYIENKQKLQENIDSLQNDVLFANQRYEGLKEHIESKLKIAKLEINKEKEHGDKEISIYEAKIRKTQLNNESLEGMYKILLEEFNTRTNENNELVQICDSLVENLEAKNNELL